MRVWTRMRSAPACVEHRQKVQGARDVRAGQNCGGGWWAGKPRERQPRACARCRDDAVGCQATLLLLSGLSPTILLLLLSTTKLLLLIRTDCPSCCVGNVLALLDIAAAFLNILVDVSSAECRCWMNKWLTLWLKPWPFYMVFSLFICPSIGRLARLVGVAISTKVLSQELWWKTALVSGVVSRHWSS